jgi:hypothetical protein
MLFLKAPKAQKAVREFFPIDSSVAQRHLARQPCGSIPPRCMNRATPALNLARGLGVEEQAFRRSRSINGICGTQQDNFCKVKTKRCRGSFQVEK